MKITGYGIPETALNHHIAILGATGSGKTNFAKVLAEDLLARKKRVCVIDSIGSWWGMRLLADGKTAAEHECEIYGGPYGLTEMCVSDGEALASYVSSHRNLLTIIDTSLLKATERPKFFREFAAELNVRYGGELTVIVDDAYDIMPQAPSDLDEELKSMWNAEHDVISRVRRVGLRIVMVSQQARSIGDIGLSRVRTLVCMGFSVPIDKKTISGWIEDANRMGVDIVDSPLEVSGCTFTDVDSVKYDEAATTKRTPRGDAWIWNPEQEYLKRVHTPLASTYDVVGAVISGVGLAKKWRSRRSPQHPG